MEPIHDGLLSLHYSKYASDVATKRSGSSYTYGVCRDKAIVLMPAVGVILALDLDLQHQQQAHSAGWLAAPHFSGQIIQIGCRCESGLNRNGTAQMTSQGYECRTGESGERKSRKSHPANSLVLCRHTDSLIRLIENNAILLTLQP